MSSNKFLKKQVSLMFILLIVKIIGFIKQIILAAVFGTTFEVDVYNLSSGFVGGIAQMIFGAISVAILPIYTKILVENGRKESSRYITKIIKLSLLFASFLVVILLLFAPNLSKLISSGYTEEQLRLVTTEIRIFTLSIYFFALSNIFMVILDAEKVFVPFRVSGIINSVSFILVALLIGKEYGGNALVLAAIVSWAFQLVNIYLFARNYYSFDKLVKIPKVWMDTEVKTVLTLALPMLIGNTIIEINDLVDKTISTGLTIGSLSSLSYAQILKEFVVFIFVTSLSSVLFSYISTYVAQGKNKEVSTLINKSMRVLVIVLIPITLYTFIFSEDIVRVAFMRGEFNQKAAELCTMALRGYSLGFIFIGIRECINKTHYSYQDTKIPLFNGSLAVIVNIVCSIILSKYIGVAGISTATSISAFIACSLSLFTIKKHNKDISIFLAPKSLVQILFSFILTIIVSYLFYNNSHVGLLRLVIGMIIVFVPYLTCLALLKNQELLYLIDMLIHKHSKNENYKE